MMMKDGASMTARKVTENASERLTVTLDAGDRAELERLAKDTDRSLAWIVRDAIRQYLGKGRAAGPREAV
jgi:hypothetical protein